MKFASKKSLNITSEIGIVLLLLVNTFEKFTNEIGKSLLLLVSLRKTY